MNGESNSKKHYLDYVRDAQALRARHLDDPVSKGWRCMREFIRSYKRRLGDIPRLTRNS
jgi:hypothetical protein